MISTITAQVVSNHAIHDFGGTVGLRVPAGRKLELDATTRHETSLKLRRKPWIMIRYDRIWESVQSKDIMKEAVGDVGCAVRSM